MICYLSTAEGNAWLQEHLTNRVCWLGLHLSDPGPGGDVSTEVLGAGYVRQLIQFGPPSAKTVGSINNQIFSGMPAAIIAWLSVWSAQYSGQMILALQQDSLQTVLAGQQYLGAAGDVAVSI